MIGIRVDLPNDLQANKDAPSSAKRVKLGNRVGFQTDRVGMSDGVSLRNLAVGLELTRAGRQDDVSIILAAPSNEFQKTKRRFDSFISSFRFW
jgi:hypothetical protein